MRTQDILLPLLAIYAAILPSSGVQGERAQVLRRRQQDNTENHVTAGDAQNQVDNAENHVLVAAPDNHDFVTPVDAQNQEDNAENHVLVAEPDNHDGGTLPYPTPYPTTAGDAQNLGSSISGGHQVEPLDGLYMVYLRMTFADGQKFQCGGTLIHAKYVLTAAHCMFDKENNLISADGVKAVIGRHDLNDKTAGVVFNVLQVIPFPQYNPAKSSTDFDFLILMLDGQSFYPPIALDLSPIDTTGKDENLFRVRTMGWGYTSNAGSLSKLLLYADLDLWDYEPCAYAIPPGTSVDDKTQLCAYAEGEGICTGDSGGPLIKVNTGELIGINSKNFGIPGTPCGNPLRPDVFSRISYAAGWINSSLMAEEDNSI